MRQLTDVIHQILVIIPAEEEELIAGLHRIRDSALFSPPESQGMWWREAAEHLVSFFPTENRFLAWHHQVANIWSGKSDESDQPIIVGG